MMAVQIDDDFLNELGLGEASDEQKKEFIQKTAETLEMRVGNRIVEGLTDEQLDEFEALTPEQTDSPEVMEQKHAKMVEWLAIHHPNPKREQVIQEEFDKLKSELKAGLAAFREANQAGA